MTVAKLVQVSTDGITWHTLPGGSGEWNDEADQIDDTIFNQLYQSNEVGLITWGSNANALYKGFAGYVARLRKAGISTGFVTEAMSLVSGKTYKIDAAAKNVWNRAVAVTVFDNAVDHTADVESINYLFGQVTFKSTYTVTGAVTVTGSYFPLGSIGKANAFTLTQTVNPIDKSTFDIVQSNLGYREFDPGLKTVSLELSGFYDVDNEFQTILEARDELIIEINPDGSGMSLARGFFKLASRGQSGDVGALEEETTSWTLNVPPDVDVIFNWAHDPATTLTQAVRILLDAFVNNTKPFLRYLPEGLGAIGFEGQAVLTDVTLSSGLDAMNEFAANFQGDGAPTRGTGV